MDVTARVVVIGAGPAGLTVANVLRDNGISCVLLEARTREFIENRPRAGFLEEWAVRSLDERGLADHLLRAAPTHTRCEFRFEGIRRSFEYTALVGRRHYVYPQQFLVTDLAARYLDSAPGGQAYFEVDDVELHDVETTPSVSFRVAGSTHRHRVSCDVIAGCDGAQGVTRDHVGGELVSHDYGIGWLALLAEAPPSADGVLFGIHPRGFAAHMARTPDVTRFYLQCPAGDAVGNWPDERIWEEIQTRLAVADGPITPGPVFEKRVLDMHNYVVEPMRRGSLFLAGESAHLVAPIAAKGMNLALHDAFLLADGIVAAAHGDDEPLARYSDDCLRRVWQYQEFSQWLSDVFHGSTSGRFSERLAQARLRRLFGSAAAATSFAEIYLGMAADF